jgi:putative flippase GtrA
MLGSAIVGIVATIADLAVLNILVRYRGWTPLDANLPSLLCGSIIQFVGNRNLVFRAFSGHLGRQSVTFVLVEATAYGGNAGLYALLVRYTPIPYTAVRLVASGVVYWGFSYPLWKYKVFPPPLER